MFAVIGKGVYTIPQAARLLRLDCPSVNSPSVHRWAFGYRRRGTLYPPIIRTDAQKRKDNSKTLNFLELVELMHIASLLEGGISWPRVREAVRVAQKLLGDEPHPFATRQWFSDASTLYMQLGETHDEPILVEMAGAAQVAMKACLKAYLREIEFNSSTGVADKWRPMGLILVDPHRSFGLPIVAAGGVRTDVLADHARAGDSVNAIAAWYDVAEPEVEAAIEFEERLSPAA